MAYYDKDTIAKARSVDLLTYLQRKEPDQLVRISSNTYCTREHDSLKISNGAWHWFSQNIGGYSALDYLIKVKGFSFQEAMHAVTGDSGLTVHYQKQEEKQKPQRVLLPNFVENPKRVRRYLVDRGIHPHIIDYCISHGLLYEEAKFHNVVFLGYDPQGEVRYGAVRSTTSPYKGDLTGSSKRYSFSISGDSREMHLFECAIDLLSYATMELETGRNWKRDTLLSLAGVYITKREDVVPVALEQYLLDHPGMETIHLHLDNDTIGRGAVIGIVNGLKAKYTILDEPPRYGKDVNEMLQIMKHTKKKECER